MGSDSSWQVCIEICKLYVYSPWIFSVADGGSMLSAKCIGCLQLLCLKKRDDFSTKHTPYTLRSFNMARPEIKPQCVPRHSFSRTICNVCSAYVWILQVEKTMALAQRRSLPPFQPTFETLWDWAVPTTFSKLSDDFRQKCEMTELLTLLLICQLICWKQFSIRRLTAAATCRLHRDRVRPLNPF